MAQPQGAKHRGVFERPRGSGTWWVRYADEHGRIHREKAGPKSLALRLYTKRKAEVQERRFFPERFRRRDVLLADFIRDYPPGCRECSGATRPRAAWPRLAGGVGRPAATPGGGG
jgi:hypothetical protein